MRWLMIDRITEIVRDEYACAVKNVTLGEDHIHDHFPGFPTWPRSLITEGLAQTGGILAGYSRDFRESVFLAKVNRMTFFDMALPGDQVLFRADLEEIRPEGASIRGTVTVRDRKIAEGTLMFALLAQGDMPERADGERSRAFAKMWLSMLGIRGVTFDSTRPADEGN